MNAIDRRNKNQWNHINEIVKIRLVARIRTS